jgi:hypothetical protein
METNIIVTAKNEEGKELRFTLMDDGILKVRIHDAFPGDEDATFTMDPESARRFLLSLQHTFNG